VNTLHRHTMTTYTTAQYVATITSQAMRIAELEDQVSALRRELANAEDEREPEREPVATPKPEPVTVPPPAPKPEPVTVPPPAPKPEPVPTPCSRFIVGTVYSTTATMNKHGKVYTEMCYHKVVSRTHCFVNVQQVNEHGEAIGSIERKKTHIGGGYERVIKPVYVTGMACGKYMIDATTTHKPTTKPSAEPEPMATPQPAPKPTASTPYDKACAVLGLSGAFTPEEFRLAYRATVRASHPDKGGTPEAFREVQNARAFITKVSGGW
jgi:biotin carboxyl carrier protein